MKQIILTLAVVLTCLTMQAQAPCVSTFTDGSFSVGVKVTFETLANGTDVKVSFELLDTNLIAELGFIRDAGEPINQRDMTKDDTNKFSIVLTNQTGTISHRFYMVIQGGGDRLTQPVDYTVGSDCAGSNDTEAPTDVTASIGEVTAISVEFLLNGKDNSGTVAYYVTGNGTTSAVSGPSDELTSVVVSGLNPETEYSFTITAQDLAGNAVAPIVLNATTLLDASTPCEGSSSEAQSGQFEIGYNYSFETLPSGTEVKITFELLDQGRGLAFINLWRSPFSSGGFEFTPMTLVSGQKYESTVTGLSDGEVIIYSCEMAVAGGSLIPIYREYTVGDSCSLSVNDLDVLTFSTYPNPTTDNWKVSTKNINISSIQVLDILGKNVMSLNPNSSDVLIDGTSLKAGMYFAQIKTASGIQSLKLIKK
jgi:hypothetical protein